MRANSRRFWPRSARRRSVSLTAERKAASSWLCSPSSLPIAVSIEARVCRPVHMQLALPPGDEAALERHLVVHGQGAAPLHPETILLHDAVIAFVAGHGLKGVLRYAHAELGYGFHGAGLLVADG